MTNQTIAQLFDLTKKGAIVTGGAVGIGRGIAFRLAEAGASVMITDIDIEAAGQTVERIKAQGGKAQAIRADAGSAADAQEVVQITSETFGRIDILVNNAGIYPYSPAQETSEEIWDSTHNVNLKGVFFYSQAVAQEMIRAGRGGKIINIASIDGLHPAVRLAHYSAFKGGVIMLTKALALEFAPHDILVNAIAPGNISTAGAKAATAALVASGTPEEQMKDYFKAHVPLRRIGKPDDIAKVVLFLASGAADYVTGSLVVVDGGCLLT